MKTDPASLDRLQDIVRPDPVAWWPPSQFWIILLALAAVWALYALLMALFRWSQNAYRRAAQHELDEIQRCCDGGDLRGLTIRVAKVLKRVALVSYPREKVASLSGDPWLRFLNETCRGADFLQDPSAYLGDISSTTSNVPVNKSQFLALLASVRIWINEHRAEPVE